ncbi:MAG: hypothetical protein J6W59_05940 [Bacteroidales bacterium]|nr:hypothetical protein [Bacteroidales bacterium]
MKFQIDGFENMTPEEKLAAIEAYNPEENGWVPKATLDKATSDAAKYKKDLKEAQQNTQEATATQKSLEERIQELERERAVSGAVAKYVGLGYSPELAQSSAEALISGDYDTLFKNQQTILAEARKAAEIEQLKSTPKPAGGVGSQTQDFSKMIAEAQAKSDFAAAAYYTRLQQQETNT